MYITRNNSTFLSLDIVLDNNAILTLLTTVFSRKHVKGRLKGLKFSDIK